MNPTTSPARDSGYDIDLVSLSDSERPPPPSGDVERGSLEDDVPMEGWVS